MILVGTDWRTQMETYSITTKNFIILKKDSRSRGGLDAKRYSFFNLGARWGGWSTPQPGRLPQGKTRYPLYKGLVGPYNWSGWVQKITLPNDIIYPYHPVHNETLYQITKCHCVYHKSRMNWWEADDYLPELWQTITLSSMMKEHRIWRRLLCHDSRIIHRHIS
jgi:hypothetical protein